MLIALIAIVLGTAFFVNEVDWRISTYEDYALEADDAEALVATGSSIRKVSYVAIGLLGVLLLLAASRQPRQFVNPAMAFLAGYVLICGLSVVWSDDPALSLSHELLFRHNRATNRRVGSHDGHDGIDSLGSDFLGDVSAIDEDRVSRPEAQVHPSGDRCHCRLVRRIDATSQNSIGACR